jgi:hypothetical protein
MASFNSPGMKEQKLRVAFRIQDFDGKRIILMFFATYL